jgi:hypothetical protein
MVQSVQALLDSSGNDGFAGFGRRYGLSQRSSSKETFFASEVRPCMKLDHVSEGMCSGYIQIASMRLKCFPSESLPCSPANLKQFNIVTEEDVLHAQVKPDFGTELTPQENEELTCYLTTPQIALPLCIKFFCGDRVGCLQSQTLQLLLESVFFEALEWQIQEVEIHQVPCEDRELLGQCLLVCVRLPPHICFLSLQALVSVQRWKKPAKRLHAFL